MLTQLYGCSVRSMTEGCVANTTVQTFLESTGLHVGYGCLFVEVKIRGGCVGHIEDIVTDQNYRRIGIGKRLVTHLLQIANEFNCYRVVLQCEENNIPFYEKCGFRQSEFGMSLVTDSLNGREQ